MDLKNKHLYIDCFSGIAGDMFLGAMIDMGIPKAVLEQELKKLPFDNYKLDITKTQKKGISGVDVKIIADQSRSDPHVSYKYIKKMLRDSDLAASVIKRALLIFDCVAEAESKIHNKAKDEVVFHELGAIDSIVDIVGAAIFLEYLLPQKVTSRIVPLGSGYTQCAHGKMPVPAPATLEILKNFPVESGEEKMELCTPTGAAIVACTATEFGELPAGKLIAAGYGAGDRENKNKPNLLRLMVLEPLKECVNADDHSIVLEANIDDMNPEYFGYLFERLFDSGAKDVWFTPIFMKKMRPATMVSILCDKDYAIIDILLKESTTLGLRKYQVKREKLDKCEMSVNTKFGEVIIKQGLKNKDVLNASPEFENCKKLAQKHNVPLKEVYMAAISAYYEKMK